MSDALLVEARTTTRRVGRTFALACRLLPRGLRDDVYRLYLVFRTLDDLVDDRSPEAGPRLAALEAWTAGAAPASRETEVLEALDTRYGLPREVFAEFVLGMRDDLAGRPILTEDELELYCFRVAGTVGLVMASLLGVREPEHALPAAAALGKAMQRTNILRDIDEDLAHGRIYLSRETLERFGDPAPGERELLLRDQIARADALYDAGAAGLPLLLHGRRAIAAAGAMYREILRQIERDGYGVRPGRAVVTPSRKVYIAARSAV